MIAWLSWCSASGIAAACMTEHGSKQAFKQRVQHWASKLEVTVAYLAIRPMHRKWASCSSRGQLSFSLDLLSLDPSLWDYVIVHELLHLQVPNHGRLWKALMRAHLGDWESAEHRLQWQARGIHPAGIAAVAPAGTSNNPDAASPYTRHAAPERNS
mgnify:CR=1 FL=1